MFTYQAHGLHIASDVPLPLPPAVGVPDLVLRRGADREVPHERPPGTVLAEIARPDHTIFYTLARSTPENCHPSPVVLKSGDPQAHEWDFRSGSVGGVSGGAARAAEDRRSSPVVLKPGDPQAHEWDSRAGQVVRTVLRYPGLCDFVGDEGFERIDVHPHPGADEGLLPVLIAGALLAMHLTLRRQLVLHASAVSTGDGAVAFVGRSGMGKSTLATALCELGAALISDDLLRVDPDLRVYPGATETRLRPNARQLARDAYETADGRLATRPAILVAGPTPLAACVIPHPSRDATTVTTRRLRPVEALLRLASYPRVLGWSDPTTMAHTFQQLGDLVERVPVVEATIPWGPPFAPGVLEALLR